MNSKLKSICPECYRKHGDVTEYDMKYLGCDVVNEEQGKFTHIYECPNKHSIELWDIVKTREQAKHKILEESVKE